MYVEFVNVFEEYKEFGLTLIAFPCNQFLKLEPGTDEEIYDFAREKMGVTFPIMKKCEVNGPDAHDVWKHLRRNTKEFYNEDTGKIKNIPWNWAKFYVN